MTMEVRLRPGRNRTVVAEFVRRKEALYMADCALNPGMTTVILAA
jgi:hypothetical protein